MRILIAEDDSVFRTFLQASLTKWGHQVIAVSDGLQAWERLQEPDGPEFAILDWMMPSMDGVEVCRKARALSKDRPMHLILLTSRADRDDVVKGLEAGADDHISKPCDYAELRARIQVGVRMIDLQHSLADRVRELENALNNVKQLQGLLPICCYCKKVRNDQNYWQRVENYISDHSDIKVSHGICPDCYETIVRPEIEKLTAPEPETKPNERDSVDVVDTASVLARVDNDMSLLREMVKLFLASLPQQFSDTQDALNRQDAKAMEFAAHTLKGSVANFAAQRAVEAALRLEQMGRQGDLTGAAPVFRNLQTEIERLIAAFGRLGWI